MANQNRNKYKKKTVLQSKRNTNRWRDAYFYTQLSSKTTKLKTNIYI